MPPKKRKVNDDGPTFGEQRQKFIDLYRKHNIESIHELEKAIFECQKLLKMLPNLNFRRNSRI